MRSPTMTNTPHLVHVRRQLKRLGEQHVFGLPKSDLERDDPLPPWAAASVGVHMAHHRPWPCTLPWEKVSGKPRTYRLLFQWGDGSYVRYRSHSEQVWKPALAATGVIPPPETDRRGRKGYETTRKEGPHQLRHFYASVMQVSGVASAASFDGTGGRALPAVQRAALGQPLGNESPCTMPELGCHHEVATGRTMMQPVQLQAIPE
jgi:hypothetical protein